MADIRESSAGGVVDFFNQWDKQNRISPALQNTRNQIYKNQEADAQRRKEEEERKRREEERRLKNEKNKQLVMDIAKTVSNPKQAIKDNLSPSDITNLIGYVLERKEKAEDFIDNSINTIKTEGKETLNEVPGFIRGFRADKTLGTEGGLLDVSPSGRDIKRGIQKSFASAPQWMLGLVRSRLEQIPGGAFMSEEDKKRYLESISPMTNYITKLQQDNLDWIESKGLNRQEAENDLAMNIGQGGGSLMQAAGVTMATGGTGTAGVLFGAMKYGQVYDEARAAGIDPGQASDIALLSGITEGALEKIGLDIFFADPAKKFVSNNVAKFITNTLIKSTSEALQESSQEFGSNFWAKVSYDKQRDLMAGVFESGFIGGLLGMAGGGAASEADISNEVSKKAVEVGIPKEIADDIGMRMAPKVITAMTIYDPNFGKLPGLVEVPVQPLIQKKVQPTDTGLVESPVAPVLTNKNTVSEEFKPIEEVFKEYRRPEYIGRGLSSSKLAKIYQEYANPEAYTVEPFDDSYIVTYGDEFAYKIPKTAIDSALENPSNNAEYNKIIYSPSDINTRYGGRGPSVYNGILEAVSQYKTEMQAEEDWTENKAEDYDQIYQKLTKAEERLKEAPASQRPTIQREIDTYNKQLGEMEESHIKKYEKQKGKPELKKKTSKATVKDGRYYPADKSDSYLVVKKGDIVYQDGKLSVITADNSKHLESDMNEGIRDNNMGYVRLREAGYWNEASSEGDYIGYTNEVNEMRLATPEEIKMFKELDKGVKKKDVSKEYQKKAAKEFKESEAKKVSKPAVKPTEIKKPKKPTITKIITPKRVVDVVTSVINKRTSLDVLKGVLVDGKDLYATNLETFIIYHGDKELGNKIVDGDALKSVGLDNIGGLNGIPGMEDEDFPVIPKVTEEIGTLDNFETELTNALSAIAKDESRPVLSGVNFKIKDGVLSLATTDSYKLYANQYKVGIKGDHDFILGQDTAKKLAKVMSDGGKVKVFMDSADAPIIRFEVGKFDIYGRLVEGQFPEYTQIIPEKTERAITVDKDKLIDILKKAKGTKTAIFDIKKGEVTVNLLNDNTSPFTQKIPMKVVDGIGSTKELDLVMPLRDSGEVDFAVNADFLLQALKKYNDPIIGFSRTIDPILIHEKGDKSEFTRVPKPIVTEKSVDEQVKRVNKTLEKSKPGVTNYPQTLQILLFGKYEYKNAKAMADIIFADNQPKIHSYKDVPAEVKIRMIKEILKYEGRDTRYNKELKGTLGFHYRDYVAFFEKSSTFIYGHEFGHDIYDRFLDEEERDWVRKISKQKTEEKVKEWYSDRFGEYGLDYMHNNHKNTVHWSERMLNFFNKILERIKKFFGKEYPLREHFDEIFIKGKYRRTNGIKTETKPQGEWSTDYDDIVIEKSTLPGQQQLIKFEGFTDLTTKTLQRIEGRTEVSKQFIEDLLKQQDIKKAEKELFETILAEYDSKIPVNEFANKIKAELLPLGYLSMGEYSDPMNGDMGTYWEKINLPEEQRRNVQFYDEIIYESPIENKVGQIHWTEQGTENYFAHVRSENISGPNLLVDTRQIIELQSDLFQKGRYKEGRTEPEVFNDLMNVKHELSATSARLTAMMESWKQGGDSSFGDIHDKLRYERSIDKLTDKVAELKRIKKQLDNPDSQLNKENKQLESYRNTWQDRIIREEIKRAATDGMKNLRFPTGETAMKVEGLGGRDNIWAIADDRNGYENDTNANDGPLTKDSLKAGMMINREGDTQYLVTEVYDDGEFKAVSSMTLDNDVDVYDYAMRKGLVVDDEFQVGTMMRLATAIEKQEILALINPDQAEVFNVKTNVDKSNPIYKFYESEVYNYLRKTRDIELITDENGNTWFETKITPEDADAPVMAFARMKEKKEKKKVYEYEVDKILDEKKDKDSILTSISNKLTDFRQSLYNQYLPLAQAEQALREENDMPRAELPLDKRFELIAGSEGKAEADVDEMVERVIKPLNPKEYKNANRIAVLRRIKDRLTKDPDRKKVGTWTLEKAQEELSSIESSIPTDSLEKINKSIDEYQKIMNKALLLQVQSGRMKQEVYDAIKEENDFYAPFKVMKWYQDNGANLTSPGGKIATSQDFAKRISGIEDDDFQIQDIFETSAEQLLKSRTLAEKNLAMLDLAELIPLDKEGEFVKKARPQRFFMIQHDTAADILAQLADMRRPAEIKGTYKPRTMEQNMIMVGKAIEFAEESGFEIKYKALPRALGNANLGRPHTGRVNLRSFTSDVLAHELGHLFDTETGEIKVRNVFGQEREIAQRLSSMINGAGYKSEMRNFVNQTNPNLKDKSKAVEKFAAFVDEYIHNPKRTKELAPNFTEHFELEILPNQEIGNMIDKLADFFQKVDGLPNIKTDLDELNGSNYLEVAIRRAFPQRAPQMGTMFASKPRPGYEIVNYIKDGKDQAMEVTSEMAIALNGRPAHDTLITKMLSLAKKPFRTAVIPLNMSFQIVNPVFTDIPRLLTVSEYGLRPSDLKNFLPDFIYSFYTSLTGNFGHPNELYKEYLASGGANATFSYGLNPDAFRPKIKKLTLTERSKKLLNPINFFKTVIDDISKFSNVMEEWTKIAGYKRGSRFKGLTKMAEEIKKMREDAEDPEIIKEKLNEFNRLQQEIASEVRNFAGSPDFAKSGLDGKEINLIFMFFRTKLNEAVSDVGRLAGREGGKKAAKAWFRATTFIALPALILALINYDDDKKKDYDSLSESEKENYFVIFRNTYFTDKNGNRVREAWRIPKRGIVKFIANAVEDSVAFAYERTPESLANIAYDLIENTSPINISGENISERLESIIGSTNPLTKATYEYATGRNTFFHSDTVPDRMKYVSDYLQYKENTPEVFKRLGMILNQSPLKLQLLADSLGIQAFTQFGSKEVPADREKWTGLPIVNKFVRSSTSSGDEETNEIIQQKLEEKANQRQIETGGKSNLSYQASLMLQLNADEKEEVYSRMRPEDASNLRNELATYYAANAAKRSTASSSSGKSSSTTQAKSTTRKVATTVSVKKLAVSKPKTYKVKKLSTAKGYRVKPLKIKKYRVKTLKV